MRRGLLLVALAVLGAALWAFRDRIPGLGEPPEVTEVSPPAATQAEAKLRALREQGRPATLNEVELNSLLRYRLATRIPGDIVDPRVRLSGDTVRLQGRIAADRLPRIGELDRVRAFLPDTADVVITGGVEGAGAEGFFDVREVVFAGIPIPARFYADALRRLGRPDRPGLPATAYPFPLPPGAGELRIERGTVVLQPPSPAQR